MLIVIVILIVTVLSSSSCSFTLPSFLLLLPSFILTLFRVRPCKGNLTECNMQSVDVNLLSFLLYEVNTAYVASKY